MDIGTVMKMKNYWDRFTKGHPKFPAFLKAAKNLDYEEVTVIAVSITEPDGKVLETNLKLNAEDLAILNELRHADPKAF